MFKCTEKNMYYIVLIVKYMTEYKVWIKYNEKHLKNEYQNMGKNSISGVFISLTSHMIKCYSNTILL